MFDADKTRMIGQPYGEEKNDNTLSRFHKIPERNRRTDRQTDERTDGQTYLLYINIARQCADAR